MPTITTQFRFATTATLAATLLASPTFAGAANAVSSTTQPSAQPDVAPESTSVMAPTTEPTTQADLTEPPVPPLPPNSPIRSWFADLESTDATRRDAAATALMGLDRTQLWQLHDLIRSGSGIAPAQSAALHQIVVHDYLATEPYPTVGGGFLGVMSGNSLEPEEPRLGVRVDEAEAGFPSFRLLRPGDLILAVLVEPDAPAAQLPNRLTPDFGTLQDAIRQAGAGREIVLEVLRGGQRIRVKIRLASRPPITLENSAVFFGQRFQEAEAFWEQVFLPLLQPNVS